ncbi:antiviral helicase [Ramicandelaber brevisporus]|nr:antiviral helicase [Ramicandelaber brevisporus]
MDFDDLFSVFEEDSTTAAAKVAQYEPAPAPVPAHKLKRQLSNSNNNNNDDSSLTGDSTANGDLNSAKRGRIRIEEDGIRGKTASQLIARPATAVLADSFETEASREVAPGGIDPNSSGTEKLVLVHQVRHEVAIPKGYDYKPLSEHVPDENPARVYPFTLDPFQRGAISCIERNESVLVSAHTSAGKTVVAEYAIATSLRDKQRVIYTSPIKALSNQKYRDLLAEFGDVGLMTGDVTINPSASCLVMTTEILRSMLYRGSEVMREVKWVVYDEIHYMRDKERGVVWEETLIMLPHTVRYVFLSATIPNALEFAQWICEIHDQPCHVVYTDYRPTPLQHYLFPAGAEGIHLVVDEKGQFREENFQRAVGSLKGSDDDAGDPASGGGGGGGKRKSGNKGGGKGEASDIFKIVKMIMMRQYHPVIVFSFSRKQCEFNALQMSKLNLNSDTERDLVNTVFNNAIHTLSEEDRKLPHIENILPLLRRGIGIHHSGLLPLIKEVIELLFQEGLLKVLFATETFSIGLNMPSRTVVFTGVRKWDGTDFRWVSGGEYIQMSGRAGRRGLDDRGIVILMIDEKMEPPVAKSMVLGQADPLYSAFRLKYNMILNLMRVEGMSAESMLERSFFHFQNCATVPKLQQELSELESNRDSITVGEHESAITQYHAIQSQMNTLKQDMHAIIIHPTNSLPFIQNGRLTKVHFNSHDFGWGVIVNMSRGPALNKTKGSVNRGQPEASDVNAASSYIVEVLLLCSKDTKVSKGKDGAALPSSVVPPPAVGADDTNSEMVIVPVPLDTLQELSSLRVKLADDLRPAAARQKIRRSLQEVAKRMPNGLPVLDTEKDMKITDEGFKKLVSNYDLLKKKLEEHPLHKSPVLDKVYDVYKGKLAVEEQIKQLKHKLQATQAVIQLDELKSRKRVLRRLGYISESDVIEVKGRVACELSTGDELMLTELIFNGVFNTLTTDQIVALLSCFAYQTRADSETVALQEDLAAPYRILQDTARRIARVSNDANLTLNEEEYVKSFTPNMMDVAYAWSRGAKFIQVCKMSDMEEGIIVRAFRRLEELLRQMAAAAKSIGNTELENRFAEGITKIKRDIIFASSLYL